MRTPWVVWGCLCLAVLAIAVSAAVGEPSGSLVGPAYSAVDQPWSGHVPSATGLAILSLTPNPFSPSMEVSLQSRVLGPVTMEIYDVSGKLVRSVLLGNLGPGLHRARWDGRDAGGADVSSGVYFIRVRNPAAVSRSVKAVLVR